MNITSYNVTDVGYHYIGLRVLAGLPSSARRDAQTGTISRSVRKYVSDRALRLMLPEPRGTFETIGEKVCQELVHFQFAKSLKGVYEITEQGRGVLHLLDNRQHRELRRVMVKTHLKTYDNLRVVVQKHLDLDGVWRPIVEVEKYRGESNYIARLLQPTFGDDASRYADHVLSILSNHNPKRDLEDVLQTCVLRQAIPEIRISESIFRSMCDRLASLRLLNLIKARRLDCEFDKTYAVCTRDYCPSPWYSLLKVELESEETFTIYICEPDMDDGETLEKLLEAICEILNDLTPTAGYYGLPEVRDRVCEQLKIPEGAFDEGLNRLLDRAPSPLTVGLQYDGITARRRPMVRNRNATQIYNLIRRT